MKMNEIKKVCDIDLNAKYYLDHSALQYITANLALGCSKFAANENILDVGCGDGRITSEISEKVPGGKVIGIDASANMIQFARESFPKSKFPNLEFQTEKAENLSLLEKFNAIVSFSCFHWIREPQKALRLLSDYLNPGGSLMIVTYPKESPYYEFMQIALENYPEFCDLSAYKTMLSEGEYISILKNLGLEIEEASSQKMIASYKDSNEIKNFIRGWLVSFVPLPEHLHEEFLELAVRKSASYAIEIQNGFINLPYIMLSIKARKPCI